AAFSQPASSEIHPSHESARQNAFLIFNSLRSAMRQWGSSLYHNGMSLIPATIPRGTTLYHGARSNSTPTVPEWLAFDREHAEWFAHALPYNLLHPPRPKPTPSFQKPLSLPSTSKTGTNSNKTIRGYLHTFTTARPLHLLYLDGSSAANSYFGTLDTQDYLLRLLSPSDNRTHPILDFVRARDLCGIITEWGYDGVIRMEIGFEVIFCREFTPEGGLRRESLLRSPGLGREGFDTKRMREGIWRWARAVGERYEGIGGGRVRLDFSRMVSALWYPVDLGNPDGEREREGLRRLVRVQSEELVGIRNRVEELAGEGGEEGVDWQGVVDMVVARYAERLRYMSWEGIEEGRFVEEVYAVTDSYVEYPPAEGDVTVSGKDRERCEREYLMSVEWRRGEFTEEDSMIYVAISRVMERICEVLFDVRDKLEEAQPGLGLEMEERGHIMTDKKEMKDAVRLARSAVKGLTEELRWTTWKKCRGCAPDEICFVAMWPYGRIQDHYSPSC
ncbi:hypothetical protein B0T14DRAFT_413491, partial [Immersiella caudata]